MSPHRCASGRMGSCHEVGLPVGAATMGAMGNRSEYLDSRILDAELAIRRLYGLQVDQRSITVRSGASVRVLSTGEGPPVLLLHGATMTAAAWAPLMAALGGFRLHAVELPGHGLSDAGDYRTGGLRPFAQSLLLDVVTDLVDSPIPMIGNSLGAMFALWFAADHPELVTTVISIGTPAIALPGTVVRMPLALLNLPVVGRASLRFPLPRLAYKWVLRAGLGTDASAAMPACLLDELRLSARRNATSLAQLNRAMNRFTQPRVENVMTAKELRKVVCRPLFIWGSEDCYLGIDQARKWVAASDGARIQETPGGHAPWIADPHGLADIIAAHLRHESDQC